ncbi:TlpA family protein disulfide reductase [Pontibaca salina]|uniref:TlpA family protein disulfide reductase n=1 Tax=Pontibaca salina TaxID=2795731 RepID=A0A934HNA2_9RHOB|nr:TlpA disulfide reductase family protein [Pontibaca salina]MBI6628727.1 TlpA family protein disulfide reductase [Pontibaca salina]
MRLFRFLILYMALAVGANTALADSASLEALREGDMRKLNIHSTAQPVSDLPFDLADGAGTATLADWQGKWVVLNFWATWCAPCRKEMPHLSALQSEFGGDSFEVLTLASGPNSPTGIKKFLDEIDVDNLPRHQDPRQAVSRDMGVLGLPITVILNPAGKEIARLQGDADWHSESARAIIAHLINQDTN